MDVIIIGAGIIGLSIARALKEQTPSLSIAIFEKEAVVGLHASGRNSGVLHSGIYYDEHSLKARFCRDGALAMASYCYEHHLPIKRLGKVIIPLKSDDQEVLKRLQQRAVNNGARVHLIDGNELRKIEPEAESCFDVALFSPDTSVVDARVIVEHLCNSLRREGVLFYFNSACTELDINKKTIRAGNMTYSYGQLYNTAGLYADKIAAACGLEDRYTMIPFKGLYYELKNSSHLQINHLIYPVPDLNVPFLGVHSTTSIKGKTYLGPTAIPALGREHYTGIKGIKCSETLSIAQHVLKQYFTNKNGFRRYAHNEIPRLLKSQFVKAAKALIPRLQKEDLIRSSKVGIRAQLIDKIKNELVMDFLVTKTENEIHVLNAVSPGFTSAFSFARYIVNSLNEKNRLNT
jgi:L-2-hydroxyglutarate oxidase LhgO